MPQPRWPYLEWYGSTPPPSGLTDEQKNALLMQGRNMLPVEYQPGPQSPRRNMTLAEITALQREPGITPELSPPTSRIDLLAEPALSLLDDADLAKYLLFLPLLGTVRRRAVAPRPGAQKAEAILKGIDPEEEMMLYHSGSADIDESIRQNWLRPQVGGWVDEILQGATDDPDLARELAERSGAVYMSAVPEWVKVKAARATGKHVKDVTMDDIRKHGQLTMIQASKDAPIVRKLEDDRYVENLRGKKQEWWETPGYDYETRREIPFGVERGDYFAVEDIEPTHTLTGADLIQFLHRNYPATLSSLTKRKPAKKQ